MTFSVDNATNISATIVLGDRGWSVELSTRLDGTEDKVDVVDYEFADMRWTKSLVETEVLLTAWMVGRGFIVRTPWHTTELTGTESGPVQSDAEFARPR